MTSINQPANTSPSTSHSDGAETNRADELRPPELLDLIHMPHIAEALLPALTLKQATLLAGTSRQMRQIMNTAFTNTLPKIKATLSESPPAVRNYFMPLRLGSQGLLESIKNRDVANVPGVHPALNNQAANRLAQINQNQAAAMAPSPLSRVHNAQQNPQ